MIQNLRFGQMYRMTAPAPKANLLTGAQYPQKIVDLDTAAQLGIATNVIDITPTITGVFTGLTELLQGKKPTTPAAPEATFLLVTDDDAFAVAKKAGLDVDPARSKAENEAVLLKAFEGGNNFLDEVETYIKEQESAGRKAIDLTA